MSDAPYWYIRYRIAKSKLEELKKKKKHKRSNLDINFSVCLTAAT